MNLAEFALNFRYAFRVNKPKLILRLAKAVVNTSLFNGPPLRYVDFAVDFACNLHCKHCFATVLNEPARRRMTTADYTRVAKECMELGSVNFSFQGGEPLLFKDLAETISACMPSKNVISVTTNGTLLSEKKIDELKDIGVDILTISLDSAVADEHDRFRNAPGAFEKTMAGIELALKSGLRVTLGSVVTHETIMSKGVLALAALAKKLKVILYFILPVPAGRWKNNNDIFLTVEDLRYLEGLTRLSPYIRTDFQANLGGYGCGAVKEILYLTPYGDVLACPFLHISLGNIFEKSVSDIRARALRSPYFCAYHKKCLASTDAEFIRRYLSKTFNADRLPLQWEEVFGGSPDK